VQSRPSEDITPGKQGFVARFDPVSLSIQYATSTNLAARIALHQRCSTNAYGFQRWVFDRLALKPGARVLEIACGTGSLWRENADRMPAYGLVLSDFAMAMLETTAQVVPDARFVNCALPDLPFADGRFDVVIANHMLYHVADREHALHQIRRVLRDGGTLFAATNGIDHLRELKILMQRFDIDASDISAGFTLENGEAQLRRVFGDVRCEEYADSLHVTDPALVLGYLASMSARSAEIVSARREEILAAIPLPFDIMKSSGFFIARA
jgi:SAM-dependent methyltransferase